VHDIASLFFEALKKQMDNEDGSVILPGNLSDLILSDVCEVFSYCSDRLRLIHTGLYLKSVSDLSPELLLPF